MRTAEAVAGYLDVLRDRGLSTHTLRAYRGDLSGLPAVAEILGSPGDGSVLSEYANSLRALPPATSRRRLSALAGFVSWAASRRITTAGPDDLIRSDTAQPETAARRAASPAPTPRADDVGAALRQIPRQADRDQLLFGLMARLGLRPGEALALRVSDVDIDRELLTVTGWGGRQRQVVIDDNEVLQRLRNWLRTAGEPSGPLFPSPAGPGPLRYQSMAERWSGYAASAGVAVSPGDLRRAHSAEMLACGVPEWVVRDRLGQATGALPGAGGTAAAAEAAVRAWQHSRTAPAAGRHAAGDSASGPGYSASAASRDQPAGGPIRDAG